jgi:hypothetical protein
MSYFEGRPDYVPDREIRDAIRFAKRQGERRETFHFFPKLYALLLRGAPRSEILHLARRAHEELLARHGPVWGPQGEKYLGPMSDEELEGFADFACAVCVSIARKYPERVAAWLS